MPKPAGGRKGDGMTLREDELMVGHKRIMVRQIEKDKRNTDRQINDTIAGNYWAGGAGYGASVTNLLTKTCKGRTHSQQNGWSN